MDFTKFISLLDKKSLFFSRVDTLIDKYEGKISEITLEEIKNNTKYVKYIRDSAEEIICRNQEYKKEIFVNCWHVNDYEPYSMWKVHTTMNTGIAVKSTYADLKRCFKDLNPDKFGLIKYIDFNSNPIPIEDLYESFLHKRKNFSHENELRVIIFEKQKSEFIQGIYRKINLNKLIDKVVVSPSSTLWHKELTESILHQYHYDDIEVEFSALDN